MERQRVKCALVEYRKPRENSLRPQCFPSAVFSSLFLFSIFLSLFASKKSSFSPKVIWMQWKEERWVGLSILSCSSTLYVYDVSWLDRSRCLSFLILFSVKGNYTVEAHFPKRCWKWSTVFLKSIIIEIFLYRNICCSDLIRLANARYPRVGLITDNEVVSVGL